MIRATRSLDCSQSYLLGEGEAGFGSGGHALRLSSRDLLDDPAGIARAEVKVTAPITFVREEGTETMDLVGTAYVVLFLVSDRFIRVLREGGFTGWGTFPVHLERVEGATPDGHRGLVVTGRCGPIDDELSQEAIVPPPFPGGRSSRQLRGLCFQPETWDGSDVFMPKSGGWVFVVEEVKDALEAAGMTNVELRRASDVHRAWRADGSVID